jgi:hypothetical protein
MVLTQKRLKELFTYNPETGAFTRRSNKKVADSLHNGYIRMFIDNKEYLAHRLVWLYMTGDMPIGIVDHKNHNKSDNWWDNLRDVSHQENCKNMPQYESNSSGSTGIYWHKRDKCWTSFVHVDGKKRHLGCFKDKSDAVFARQQANEAYGFYTNHGKRAA